MGARAIEKYEFSATMREGVIEWSLGLQTDDGQKHALRVRDGEEVPILLDLLRHDTTVYFDPAGPTVRTGWNAVGKM